MGVWSSLKGQIGRDTGKVVSNLVWKDKHASVYRRAESRKQETLDLKKKQLEADIEQQEIEQASKEEREAQERLDLLSEKYEEKILRIAECEIPESKKELVDTLNQLVVLFKSNPFKDESNNREHKISNNYTEAILTKYEQTLLSFESLYPQDALVQYHSSLLKSFKKGRTFKKNMSTILLVIGLIGVIVFFGIMAYLQDNGYL